MKIIDTLKNHRLVTKSNFWQKNKIRKRNVIIFFSIILLILIFICIYSLTFKNKDKTIIKNNEILSDKYGEASPFVWKNSLKYFVSERKDKENYFELAIYDFNTRKKEASFGTGFALGSATVIDDTLYITATKEWDKFGKSEIYLTKSNDLKKFSEPKLIYKASEDQAIYNTSLTKNTKTGEYIITYESRDDKTVPFTIYFLHSSDGVKWNPIEGSIFGKDIYVACPTIKYIDNNYYLFYGMEEFYDPNCLECRSFITKIAKSKDLKNWITSPKQFMVADIKDEGINNADVDLVEFNGKTYIFYSIGDQQKWQGIKYATYNSTLKELVNSFLLDK